VPRTRGRNTTLCLPAHDDRGDGAVYGCGGGDHRRSLRGLHQGGALTEPARRTDRGVMDNLGAHRPKRIRELIEGRGCEIIYLPAYSPDYNPIEEAFSKIKGLLCRAAARSKGALVEAICVWRCRRSVPQTPGASSSTLATVHRFSYRETRCESSFPKGRSHVRTRCYESKTAAGRPPRRRTAEPPSAEPGEPYARPGRESRLPRAHAGGWLLGRR